MPSFLISHPICFLFKNPILKYYCFFKNSQIILDWMQWNSRFAQYSALNHIKINDKFTFLYNFKKFKRTAFLSAWRAKIETFLLSCKKLYGSNLFLEGFWEVFKKYIFFLYQEWLVCDICTINIQRNYGKNWETSY